MTEERIELNSGNIIDESLLRVGGEANRNIKFVWMGRGGQWEEEIINWLWSTRKAGVGERGKERQAKTSCVRWTWLPPSQVRREADGCQTGPVNMLFTRDRTLR